MLSVWHIAAFQWQKRHIRKDNTLRCVCVWKWTAQFVVQENVVEWRLVSINTFSVMNDIAPQNTRSDIRYLYKSELSAWWLQMATFEWMDGWTGFRPLFCTITAELGRGQPGLMRWSWDETLPQSSIDRSTLDSAAHRGQHLKKSFCGYVWVSNTRLSPQIMQEKLTRENPW